MSHFHPLTVLSTIQVAFIRRYYLIEREIIFDLDIRSYSKPSHKLKLALAPGKASNSDCSGICLGYLYRTRSAVGWGIHRKNH